MNTTALPVVPASSSAFVAAARREWLSHRLNRFLHAHVALILIAGSLPLLTPGEALARGAAWWLLHAVLYAISLSSLLLGLSSAHAEADEFTWILGQPSGTGPWLLGKAVTLILVAGGSTVLLGVPLWLAGGADSSLLLVLGGAAGVATVCALLGLALGMWVRDGVRGLIGAVGVWFVLLFGLDLLLLGVAGSPAIQSNPTLWVAVLMGNPLDAFRIAVLFSVERAAFTGLNAGALASWWAGHAPLWLGVVCGVWGSGFGLLAWAGASRRLDS